MPVNKIYLFSLTIIICLLFVFPPLMQAKTCSPNEMTIATTAKKDSALEAMLGSFEIYYSFLNDIKIKQGYYLPLHGQTRTEAINYLEEGFAENLATAIVDEYTCFIPELECLAIMPGDGLPVLKKDDIPHLGCKKISDKYIVFSREFVRCYSLEDRYRYQVEMQLYDDHWKVSALRLEEI